MINSKCNGLTIKGDKTHVIRAYEKLAYDAERDDNHSLAQLYFNHAEHYKKNRHDV